MKYAKLITKWGGEPALINYLRKTKGNSRLPGIMALGYMASYGKDAS